VSTQKRFLQPTDVAEILDISMSQVYALVRRNELRAVKIGGRGQWRVEISELEAYIARCYDETDKFIAAHPFGPEDLVTVDGVDGADN
jgi:excisionase family DNA binding protein